jgi:thioredoxin 1
MKTPIKILIVAALAVTVVAAVALKQRPSGEAKDTTRATTESGITAALPRLVDLGAGKCIPRKKMAPILEELKKEYAGRMEVEFIDVRKNADALKAYMVEVIPMQIFYHASGKELDRHTGFFGKEDILGKWKELGVELAAAEKK